MGIGMGMEIDTTGMGGMGILFFRTICVLWVVYGFYRASEYYATQMPCLSYGKSVRPSVRPSVCLSVRHTLLHHQNDTS